jgi:hypothetical protein
LDFATAASGGPRARALASARNGNSLCGQAGPHEQQELARMVDLQRQITSVYFYFEQRAAAALAVGPQQASPNQVLILGIRRAGFVFLPTTLRKQSIGLNNKMSPVLTRLLLYQRAVRMNRVLWPKDGRDRRDKCLIPTVR